MLLNGNNSGRNTDFWRWKFVGQGEVSRTFSIKFSESSPKHWIIETSELDTPQQVKDMKRVWKKACDSEFVTIECDFEAEQEVRNKLGMLVHYVTNLETITCIVGENVIFTLKSKNALKKAWEVQIDN